MVSLSAFRSMGIELRLLAEESGGDLNLGDIGKCGELSPDLVGLSVREPSSTPSTLGDCIEGLFADNARCKEVIEGTEANELLRVVDRVGLNS